MESSGCPLGANLEGRVKNLEHTVESQWRAINEARRKYEEALREVSSRLPNWAAAVFMVASGLAGGAIAILGTLLITAH